MKLKNGMAALAVVCILWGTTYFAIKIGVKSFPPLLFSGIRQIVAAILLLVIIVVAGKKFDWSFKNLIKQSVIGFLLICMGNGLVGWAEVYIPSGLAALIASLIPLNIVIINLISGNSKGVNINIITGLVLGLFGMLFIFKDNLKDLGNAGYYLGLMMALTASVSWSIGTVLVKKFNSKNITPYHNTALQFLCGGIIMTVAGFIIEDSNKIQYVDMNGWYALGYLIIFGSIIALLCYQYAIKVLPISTVAVYAYINPLIAIILGCTFLNEKFTWYTAIAFALTITGIYLVNNGNKKSNKSIDGKLTLERVDN